MRVDVPGPGGHWVELRDVDSLTAADDDAWNRVINQAWADVWAARADADEAAEKKDGEDASAATNGDRPRLRLTAAMLRQRRDDLLASLITDWSYAAPDSVPHIPLPYSTESRKLLPLAAGKLLASAVKPHEDALNAEAGPKEPEPQTSTTAGSGSGNG